MTCSERPKNDEDDKTKTKHALARAREARKSQRGGRDEAPKTRRDEDLNRSKRDADSFACKRGMQPLCEDVAEDERPRLRLQ